MRTALFSTLVFSAVLLAASSASAQSLEVDVRPGFGSSGSKSPITYAPDGKGALSGGAPDTIFGGTASPYGVGFTGDASVGLKLNPFVSFGLAGQYRSLGANADSASAGSAGITGLSRKAIGAGFYAHVYIPIPLLPVTPWVGIGAEYLHDKQQYTQLYNGVDGVTSTVHYGVAIPITAGVLYPFLHFFAVGPSFTYQPVVAASGCYGFTPSAAGFAGANYCTNSSPGEDFVKKSGYSSWTLGLDVRVSVP